MNNDIKVSKSLTENLGYKIKFPLILIVFFFTIMFSNLFKTSINEVDRIALANDIQGIGKIKAEKIIKERELHGNFKNEKDFYERTKNILGDTTFTRVKKTYSFNG